MPVRGELAREPARRAGGQQQQLLLHRPAGRNGGRNLRRARAWLRNRRTLWSRAWHHSWRKSGRNRRYRKLNIRFRERLEASWPTTYTAHMTSAGHSECLPYGREICCTVSSAFLALSPSSRISACDTTPTGFSRSSTIGMQRTCA